VEVISKLHIQTCLLDGKTLLGNCYFSPPFKVMNITEDKTAGILHLMLMSSSPGILDEDEYELKLEVSASCSLHLHTQSFQRLFSMKKGARQTMEVHLKNGASFVYLPHPSVPHESANFTARNKIYLQENCRLLWGEIITCGRKMNGEQFQFSSYHNITEIFMQGKLVIRENILMQPFLTSVQSMGQLEGFTHQASLIYLCGAADDKDFANLSDKLHRYLAQQPEIVFGISSPPVSGLMIRILGHKAEQLFLNLKNLAALCKPN
jgi:urease accessory protein